MRHELWPEVESALAAALEQPEAERLAWVAKACGNPEVRAEVESLLRVYGRAEDFLPLAPNRSPAGETCLNAGAHLGPYEILSLVGAGGMGEVYRARDPRIGREVAIKVLAAPFAADPDRLRRFALESRAAGSLNHPNILAIYDVGTHDSVPYLVTELLEGETLGSRLKRGALSLSRTLEHALAIATGLAAAHSKGIVHRDLKPENIFLAKNGQTKILDFGLARLTQPGATNNSATSTIDTAPGMLLGTAAYMSPEQVRGEPCDHRSDIFSFGAILYEMASGKKAFPGDSQVESMSAVLKAEPPEPSVPSALLRILRRCLEKHPAERFQSASDLAFSLESFAKTLGIETATTPVHAVKRQRPLLLAFVVVALVALYTAGIYWAGLLSGKSPLPSFRQLTFRRGSIFSARFAPDGHTIVYGAQWDDHPLELFLARPESPESRPIGFSNTEILGISSTGEMAISLRRHYAEHGIQTGTLARVPFTGGAPREVLEDVQEASWGPDGSLAVVIFNSGRSRIEFPIGNVLHQATTWLTDARVSPNGAQVAFIEHPRLADDSGSVSVVDLHGNTRTLSRDWRCSGGLAWSADGRELWFTAARVGNARALYAVSLSGKERLIARVAGALILQDISRDGSVLVTRDHSRRGVSALAPGEAKERDLSWFDNAGNPDIAEDGSTILFGESGEGGGPRHSIYIRNMDGSPAIRLGDGYAFGLSRDGKWAMSLGHDAQEPQLVLLPTGVGTSRVLPRENILYQRANWFSDGRRVLILGNEPDHGLRLYVRDLAGGKSVPITPEGITAPRLGPSPDGRYALARRMDGKPMLYPVEDGRPTEVAGLTTEEAVQWTADGRSLYVYRRGELPARVYRLDVATGRKDLWKELTPSDPTGVFDIGPLALTTDGKAYVYTYGRLLSNLYLLEGLR